MAIEKINELNEDTRTEMATKYNRKLFQRNGSEEQVFYLKILRK